MLKREDLLKKLQAQLRVNGHIVGAVAGCGITAECTAAGGVDFLLALSAGKYRMMGRGSLASYLCYGNSNEIVMEMGKRELLPLMRDMPVLFGLFASDPGIHLYDYLLEIKRNGFSGIVNYPTLGAFTGLFRTALEEEGNNYEKEAEAIRVAHLLDMFTVAFVANTEEARVMAEAGADVICVHLGPTRGGNRGPKQHVPLAQVQENANAVFSVCESVNPNAIRMLYAGSASTPVDMQYIYQNTSCQGYIGGSTFDRIPIEYAVVNTTRAFKSDGSFDRKKTVQRIISGNLGTTDYAEFLCSYIQEYYMCEIQLSDLAAVLHLSASYLSRRFKKDIGCCFTEYLIRFRMNRASELMQQEKLSCKEAAAAVGYADYAQFSKMFKKYMGKSPNSVTKYT